MKKISFTILLAFIATSSAIGADKKISKGLTKEQREQMAVVHEEMATCLRSEKSMHECQSETREACKEKIGDRGCLMMGMDKMRKRMGSEKEEKEKNSN